MRHQTNTLFKNVHCTILQKLMSSSKMVIKVFDRFVSLIFIRYISSWYFVLINLHIQEKDNKCNFKEKCNIFLNDFVSYCIMQIR